MPVQHVRRSLLLFAVALVAALLVATFFLQHHLERTLSRTTAEVAEAPQLAFTLGPVLRPSNAGFAPVLARADFTSAAQLGDRLFLAGPGDLQEFTAAGTRVRTLTVGTDLPGFPLTTLITGRLHGTATPQLLIATAGAGVLLLQPASGKLEQLLPADPTLRDITALLALPDGDLLLGTRRRGVLRYNGDTLTLFRPEYRDLAVTALAATGDAVWVGTQADGLRVTRGGLTQHLLAGLPDPHIQALATHGNRLYAATPNGVAELQDAKLVRTLAPGSFARALAATDQDLALALFEGGTSTLPLAAPHGHIAAPSATPADAVTTQFLQSAGETYAVRANGLFHRSHGTWTPALVVTTPTLADANIAALAFAPDGRLWVGYFDHGLDILTPGTDAVHHLETDQLFCINRIAVDPVRQTMAVATANGLVLFDRAGAPRQVLGTRDGLISEHVTDVSWAPGAAGNSMALATPAGLTFVSPAGVESLYAFQGLVNNHVYSIAFSPEGNLVAGTLGGLSMLEHGTVRRSLNTANSNLDHNWISAVLALPPTAGGGFLVGTYGGGLLHLSAAGQVTAMPGAPHDAVINPNALLATPTHLLAGSLGQGLWLFSQASGRWQQLTAGLPSRNVTALAAHNGELFIGTDNGLVHLAEAQLPE